MASILIVEDRAVVIADLEMALKGHRLFVAETGAAAQILFERHQAVIDIALLDGYLDPQDPVKNTLEFIKYMRASGFKKPMVAISGDTRMCIRQQEVGCSHQVVKHPTDKAYLDKIVQLVNELTAK
ncbi:MAG: response regulator [Minisyncoccia bacterium]